MKKSLETRLQVHYERFEEVERLLSDADIIANQNQFKALSKEYALLEPLAKDWQAFMGVRSEIEEASLMAKDNDQDLAKMAQDELPLLKEKLEALEAGLLVHLMPKDPNQDKNIYLEVRAGTGGDEAAIFAGDLFRMYCRYAESQNWRVEVVSENAGEHGGFKEVIAHISGSGVYGQLKFESGTHRVQRVPETESQGRIHTSACTVAIMPEVDEVDAIVINPDDLRIDTYRSSGAGGQHVNKTDSAIRITHIPSGMVVECQEERSQHKNRAKAMSLLQTRLLDAELAKQQKAEAQQRKLQVGSGDRSERIRTYNFPQGRLTDHRINLTLYQLTDIIEGQLRPVIEALQQEHQAEMISELGQE